MPYRNSNPEPGELNADDLAKKVYRQFMDKFVERARAQKSPDGTPMLDLVEGGSTWDEVVELAKAIEAAGATIINTGIGWHEARIPTIATMVPRAAFAWVTKRLKGAVKIPLITTNRINTPEIAEEVLASGCADMVSMARPFLADADFVNKAAANRADEINTCIACNQACLDHIFNGKLTSCLVNPRACHETELIIEKTAAPKKVAIVGAGPAGMAAGKISEAAGIPPSSLSFHLKELAHAGMVTSRQEGRFVIYEANFSTATNLVAFLTENCCGGQVCNLSCTTEAGKVLA